VAHYLADWRSSSRPDSRGIRAAGRSAHVAPLRVRRMLVPDVSKAAEIPAVLNGLQAPAPEEAVRTNRVTLRELSVRYTVRKGSDGTTVMVSRPVYGPRAAAEAFLALLNEEPTEVFGCSVST
jgi:hypothetical protein